MITKRLVAALCFASVLAACSDKVAPSTSTALLVSLSTPSADDGALIITLRGPDLGSTQSIAPTAAVYQRLVSTNESRVIVVGDIARGDLLRVAMLGAHPISEYSATVTQVATRTDSLLPSTEGYVLHLREEPGQ